MKIKTGFYFVFRIVIYNFVSININLKLYLNDEKGKIFLTALLGSNNAGRNKYLCPKPD